MRLLQLYLRYFSTLVLLLFWVISFTQNIVINEINYRSPHDNGNAEFVEIYNNESTAIDISGWSLTKAVEYTFPTGTTIAAYGYTVVAADPTYVNQNFGQTIIGPFTKSLSNNGDEVRLLDKDCLLVDKVEYDSWHEWPPAVRKLDNGTYIFELSDSYGDGWNGASIKVTADGANLATFTSSSSFVSHSLNINAGVAVTVSYSSGSFDNENSYVIKDPSGNTVHSSGPPPGTTSFLAEGVYSFVSIQKINPKLPGNQPGSWASNYPTPGTRNYSVFQDNPSNVPVIKNVSRSPNNITNGEDVRIKADFSQHENVFLGTINVHLEYQVNTPGNYKTKSTMSWVSVPMLDDGIGPDSTANNAVYTAKIVGDHNKHRNLIRYRVRVVPPSGADKIYPDPAFAESNFAYYVYDAYPDVNGMDIKTLDTLPEVTIITSSAISNYYIGNSLGNNTTSSQYQGGDLLGEGTLVYNGKVFDHVKFRPRGKGSRIIRDKPGIKIGLNKEHPVTIKSDCDESYDVQRDKLVFSGGWVNDVAAHGLTESLIYKISELAGGLPRYTDYVQLRIVDNSTETGNEKGDFFGLYLLMEDYNGDYLEEHKFAEGNFWGTNRTTRNRFLDYAGNYPNASNISTFAPSNQTTGNFTIDSRGHKPLLFGDRIAAEIYGMNGNNYIGKHSYNEYYDSATQSYLGWWGDMDNSFGSPYDDVTVYPRADAKIDATNSGNMIIPASMQTEYQNEFRSVYDLMLDYTDPDCSCTQSDYLVDQETKKIFNQSDTHTWTDVDKSRWPQINYDLGSYENQRNWYKQWFKDRKSRLLPNFENINIPSRPVISSSGTTALDDIFLDNSAFSDLQGTNTFAALEWRVGEWSDPANPYYNQTSDPKYEIETKWSSGEISEFAYKYKIPAEAKLKEDRTYLIRVRYKDTSGNWSHWSQPVKIVPTPAINTPIYDLVINEIMYNPSEPDQAEFIEIYNANTNPISLNNVQFNEGIDFEFAAGSTIAGESYLCIAKDSASFFKAYGYFPYADYGGGLSNSGELVRLVGPFRTIIDTVRYNDEVPWPGTPDKGFYSLALKEPSLDNANGVNWSVQSVFSTPCEKNEFTDLGEHAYSGIVINEIHYNPFDEVGDDGEQIESGTKFEFVELKNISSSDIVMTGAFFSRGIDFDFEPGTTIAAGDFFVLAEDKSSFESRYGFPPDGKYDGRLSNEGETIWLSGESGALMDAVTYSNAFPWDSGANGGLSDNSLALIDATVNNDTRLNWKIQCTNLYTPGAENDFLCFNGLNYPGLTINEIHYNTSGGDNLEFIEIVNTSNILLNLDKVAVTNGVTFVFNDLYLSPNSSVPNSYAVIAKDSAAFHDAYGFAPYGEFVGELSNVGETLIIQDLFGSLIDSVSYASTQPWNPLASQGNHSLALMDASLDNSLGENWCIQNQDVTPRSVNDFGDADNDLIIDCFDQCPGVDDSLANTPCDDGDPCTEGETFDANCQCTGGTFVDSDADGVCDAQDSCSNQDDSLVNMPCDDGDSCTEGETYDNNCNCTGGEFTDDDGDGICNAQDICSDLDDTLINTACDDGDPCTTGETYDTNCICSGGEFQDSDGDGICDVNDSCDGLDDALMNQPCDDGDPCTTGETYDNNCNCTGGVSPDSDNDSVCDELDECPGANDSIIGTPCDDGDPCTTGETYDTNCICSGGEFQDSDGDGICDVNDSCDGFDDALMNQPCDDGDPCTTGETYDNNCNCTGGVSPDSDNDSVCDELDECPGADDSIIGTPCDDGDPCTEGETYDSACSCTGGVFEDFDNDGICDAEDNGCDLIESDDFESGTSDWQSNGGDAVLVMSSSSPSGNYSFMIRDNSGLASSVSSPVLSIIGEEPTKISFSFRSVGLGAGEDFFVEISTDGGSSFQEHTQYVMGVDFDNNAVYDESISIASEQLSSSTVIRFRCDGGINSDQVFIDNVKIERCPLCETIVVQNNHSAIDKSRYVQESIESNGVIESGAIEFSAGSYILMNQEFEVKLGAFYHAYISPCSE